jgi:sugar phosphate isomerase/epimerase
MISASEVVGHPGGVDDGIRAVRNSGLAVTGLETLRDFEGLDGKLRDYKVDVAKSMLQLCQELGGRLLIVEAVDFESRQYGRQRNSPGPARTGDAGDSVGCTHRVQRCFVESDSQQLCFGG